MKNNTKRLSLSIMTVLLICLTMLMLGGCGKKAVTADDIVGTWTYTDESGNGFDVTYEFRSDGTMTSSMAGVKMYDGTYVVLGDTITATYRKPNGTIDSSSWTVELGEDSLILTASGSDIVRTFIKQ